MLYKNPTAEQIRETYSEYIKRFANHDWKGLREYVADNIYFYWGACMPPLVGKNAFISFFEKASEFWDEQPTAENVEITIPILRAWINNKIEVKKNWENSPFKAFGMNPKAGDTYNPKGYVNYVFNEDGQIAIIIDCDYAH